MLSRLTVPVTAAQPMTGGNGAGSTADDDVLRRPALQPHRVDDGIEEDGEGQQAAASQLTSTPSVITDSTESTRPKAQRLAGLDAAGRDRTVGGAAHHRVDIGVVPHVQRAGGAGADGNRQDGDHGQHRIDVAPAPRPARQRQ